jgi:hypothetical protein
MMQPLDRIESRNNSQPVHETELISAEIVSLDEWRRRHRRPISRWRRAPVPPPLPAPARPRKVPVEAWLMALIVVSAIAGAIFALMGLGYLP